MYAQWPGVFDRWVERPARSDANSIVAGCLISSRPVWSAISIAVVRNVDMTNASGVRL